MSIRKLIAARLNIRRDRSYKTESLNWLGRDFNVLPGTIRAKVDYDDAWYQLLSNDATNIIDIGANIGYTAIMALQSAKVESILMIDPNPEALAKAAFNIFNNGYSRKVQFRACFVSDESNRKLKFFTIGSGAAGSRYADHVKSAKYSNSWMEVETETLDAIVSDLKFGPDLIKVDVEGAEYEVLKGASKTAEKFNPAFFVEMHSNKELPMKKNADNILSWCSENNYNPWYLKEHKLMKDSSLIAHRGKCHLLILPVDRPYPDGLSLIKQKDNLKH